MMHWMPHGYCFNWELQVLIPWILGNLGTWICYVILPVILFRHGYAVYTEYPNLRGLFLWFAGFIVSCGCNHFLHVWTLWRPDYVVEAVMQVITFVVSSGAVWTTVKKLPHIHDEVTFVLKEERRQDGSERVRAVGGAG